MSLDRERLAWAMSQAHPLRDPWPELDPERHPWRETLAGILLGLMAIAFVVFLLAMGAK